MYSYDASSSVSCLVWYYVFAISLLEGFFGYMLLCELTLLALYTLFTLIVSIMINVQWVHLSISS